MKSTIKHIIKILITSILFRFGYTFLVEDNLDGRSIVRSISAYRKMGPIILPGTLKIPGIGKDRNLVSYIDGTRFVGKLIHKNSLVRFLSDCYCKI
jgi:hypothetical protein